MNSKLSEGDEEIDKLSDISGTGRDDQEDGQYDDEDDQDISTNAEDNLNDNFTSGLVIFKIFILFS